MPEKSKNIGLNKPLGSDKVTREAYNDNLVIIDDEFGTRIKNDGSMPMNKDWNAGAVKVTAKSFSSTTTTETPLVVASTVRVLNLNADQLDGHHAEVEAKASAIPIRDESGFLEGHILGNAATATTGPLDSSGFLYLLSSKDGIDLTKKISRNELSTDNGSWLIVDLKTIWTEFELLNINFRAARLLAELSVASGTVNGDNRVEVKFRRNVAGSTEEPRPLVLQSILANDKRELALLYDVAVDNGLKLQMKWNKTLTSGGRCGLNLYLVGIYK